jgi:hypothetical protein
VRHHWLTDRQPPARPLAAADPAGWMDVTRANEIHRIRESERNRRCDAPPRGLIGSRNGRGSGSAHCSSSCDSRSGGAGGEVAAAEAGSEVVVVAEPGRRRALYERVGLGRGRGRGRERRASVGGRKGWRVRRTPS